MKYINRLLKPKYFSILISIVLFLGITTGVIGQATNEEGQLIIEEPLSFKDSLIQYVVIGGLAIGMFLYGKYRNGDWGSKDK